ncbi:uncharacterized protein LOC133314052 [Gastrolobium bilobum]|uniref:uncharacterized protein LOC133314052 n=1 Tax=Gastrolobium bilobum TaxID=150636 RepID=UPI002AB138C6|nr:uncharacterized protein LOC133314052 [Gastrolobium bilobum]
MHDEDDDDNENIAMEERLLARLKKRLSMLSIGISGLEGHHYTCHQNQLRVRLTSLDIWSLGCIVIEMITGLNICRNPLTSKEMIPTTNDMMYKLVVLKEAPKIPNGVSEDCRDFLSKGFIKNPSQRWIASKLLHRPFLFSPCDSFGGYERFHMVNLSSSFFTYDRNWLSFKA